MMPLKTANLFTFLTCGLLAAIIGCGGGSTTSSSSPAAPATPSTPSGAAATPTATCTPSTIVTGEVVQCTAQLPGSSIDWSTTAGSITPAGQFTAPTSPGPVTITATSASDSSKSAQATVTVVAFPSSRHVVMVLEENQPYPTVVGNTGDWPNFNNFIKSGALATNYYANAHNSIGDYFMLTTGQLLTGDDSSTQVWDVDNLARRLLAAKMSFRIYAEGIDWGYVGGNKGSYVIRHNPFAMLSDVAGNPGVAKAVIAPFGQFEIDLAKDALPAFSFIVPSVDDNAHTGTRKQADDWLQNHVINQLAKNSAFKSGGDGVLAVVFDESSIADTVNGGGQVVAALWGPIVKQSYTQTSTTLYQHQSMLRTVMMLLGLPDPPAAAATAPTMAEFFVPK